MTREQARELVALLRTAYPMKSVSADTVKLYELRLAREGAGVLHFEIAREAILELVDREKFWPAIAEVMEAYREVSARRRRQDEDEEQRSALPPREPDEIRAEKAAAMRADLERMFAKIGRPMMEEPNAVEDFDPDGNGHNPDGDIPL